MNDVPLSNFQEAIRATHGAEARLLSREAVNERFEDQPVWEGEVLVFELEGHPTAHLCYAWKVDGEVTAVLHEPPVDSPQAAIRIMVAKFLCGRGADGIYCERGGRGERLDVPQTRTKRRRRKPEDAALAAGKKFLQHKRNLGFTEVEVTVED